MDKVILYKRNVGGVSMYSVDKDLDDIFLLSSLDMNDNDDPYSHSNSHIEELIFYKSRYALNDIGSYEISNSHCIGGVTDFMTGRVIEPIGMYCDESYSTTGVRTFDNKDDMLKSLNLQANYIIFSLNTRSKGQTRSCFSNIKSCSYVAERFFKNISTYTIADEFRDRESSEDRITLFNKVLSNYINETGEIFQNFEIGDIEENDETYFEKCVRTFDNRQLASWYEIGLFKKLLIDALTDSVEYVKKSIENYGKDYYSPNSIISKIEFEKYKNSLKGKRVTLKTIDDLRNENRYAERGKWFDDVTHAFEVPYAYTSYMIDSFGGKTATIVRAESNYYYRPGYITTDDFKCLSPSQITNTLKHGYIMYDDKANDNNIDEIYDSETINNTNLLIKDCIKIYLNFDDESARNTQNAYSFSLGMCKLLED